MSTADNPAATRLAGLHVMVTRPVHQAAKLRELIEARGGQVVPFPVLDILDPQDNGALQEIIGRLDQYDIAIFISANAVNKALERVLKNRTLPPRLKLAAVGKRTAQALKQYGLQGDICPREGFNSEALLAMEEMQAVQDKRILIFRGEGGRELLAETLQQRGAQVDYAEVYRRARPQADARALLRHLEQGIDVITLTSNEGLQNLFDMAGPDGQPQLRAVPLVVMSDRAAALARELHFQHTPVVVKEASDEGLAEAIDSVAMRYRRTMTNNTPKQEPKDKSEQMPSDQPEQETRDQLSPDTGEPAAQRNKAIEERPADAVPQGPARWVPLVALFAVLLALLAMGLSYGLWQASNQTGERLAVTQGETTARLEQVQLEAQRLNEIAQSAGDINNRLDDLQSETEQSRVASAESGGRLSELSDSLARLGDQQQQLSQSLQALQTEVRKRGVPQAMIEAETLIRIANHRLLLERDITSALAALTAADQRLREVGGSSILDVRRQLTGEIDALKAVERVDTAGMALTLGNLIAGVDELPPASDVTGELPESPGEARGGDWREVLYNIWSELKSLVVIRESGEPATTPLLPPEQRYFLYQNLRLELQAARLALLRNDAQNYRASLERAQNWLQRYFYIEAPVTSGMLQTLSELQQANIDPPLPEISASLNALQEIMASTTPPAAPAPEAANTLPDNRPDDTAPAAPPQGEPGMPRL